MRRINDAEVHLLSQLIMQVRPGALLGSLHRQHRVFRLYWPLAKADSFQIAPPPLVPSAPKPSLAAQAAQRAKTEGSALS